MTVSRTTVLAVGKIIEVDPTIDLEPFLLDAAVFYNSVVGTANTEEVAEMVERWLSAHFYSIRDNRVSQESAGPVSQTLVGRVDLRLDGTYHGQQAIMLDTSERLAGWMLRASGKTSLIGKIGQGSIGILWAGQTESEQGGGL